MNRTVTIKRPEWLHGEETIGSYLLRKYDGKKCCLGFDALALGATEEEITGMYSPAGLVANKVFDQHDLVKFDEIGDCSNTSLCSGIMMINDDEHIEDTEREKKLIELFAQRNVELIFVD